MSKIGLGIIGLGYIGKVHLRHSLKMPNVNVVAVSDLSKKALKRAEEDGIKKTYTNYEQLLNDPKVDSVIVALPTHLHLECAIKAAEAGKNIFLEKPIATNLKEAKQIISTAQKNSVKLMIGYPLRFNKAFGELKTRMEDGTMGDIEVAYGTYISTGPFFHRAESHAPIPVPNWWFNRELTGGGVLIDLGSHMINLLRWYFGEVTDIKSHLGHRFNLDFEDSAMCLTKFESGTTAVMTVGWFLQGYQLKLDFFGTVDAALVEHRPPNPLVAATQMLTKGMSEFYQPHFDELKYFADCMIEDTQPSPSGEDGLKDLEAIYQAYKNTIVLD